MEAAPIFPARSSAAAAFLNTQSMMAGPQAKDRRSAKGSPADIALTIRTRRFSAVRLSGAVASMPSRRSRTPWGCGTLLKKSTQSSRWRISSDSASLGGMAGRCRTLGVWTFILEGGSISICRRMTAARADASRLAIASLRREATSPPSYQMSQPSFHLCKATR